jgi:hypothetical protein
MEINKIKHTEQVTKHCKKKGKAIPVPGHGGP